MPQLLRPALQYADGNITVWRWLMLVGLLVPSYWIGEGLAQLIEAVIEWNFFENRRVLYYFIGTTVGCRPSFVTAALSPLRGPQDGLEQELHL